MIRLRRANGTVIELPPDVRFVEILDAQQRVGQVTALLDDGEMRVFTAKDSQAARYARAFKVQFCPLIRLPEHMLQSPIITGG